MLPENISIDVKESLQDQYLHEWNSVGNNSSKCVLYRNYKRNLVFKKYLTTLSPYNGKLVCEV